VIINANDCYGNSGTSDAFAPGQKTETELGAGSWLLEAGGSNKGKGVLAKKREETGDHNGSPKLNTQREKKFRNNR